MKLPTTATIVSASPDHFPGHLTRSLRRNANRRRSAPFLVRRRPPSQPAPSDPSSPVVTCFGQIRPSPAPSHRRGRCRWRCFPWRRWLLRPFRPTPTPPPPPAPPEILEATDPDDEVGTDALASAAAAPPKNALLLMRSRSESRRGSAAEAAPPPAVPRRSEPVILTRSRSEPVRVPSPDPWKSAAELELAGAR